MSALAGEADAARLSPAVLIDRGAEALRRRNTIQTGSP
jgi:hypothetical protein